MQSIRKDPSLDGPDLEDIRALIRRITHSSAFSKTERLSTLLSYICDTTLQGRSKELSEQSIGIAIFGRSPAYDTSADGIVRAQASRLRNRLDQYFQEEGLNESLQIVIPRGGYVPYFEPRLPSRQKPLEEPIIRVATPEQTPTAADTPRTVSVDSEVSPRSRRWQSAAFTTVFLILIFVGYRWVFGAASPAGNAEGFWKQVFRHDEQTKIIFGDSGLVMWHGSNDSNLGLSEYIQGDYRRNGTSSSPTLLSPTDLGNRRYTSVIDAELIHALDEKAYSVHGSTSIQFARDTHPDDFKTGDMILLGASEANPWVAMFEPHMNFVFTYDRDHQVMSVVNRSPQSSEPHRWESAKQDGDHKVYGVIAFLPNLSNTGNLLLLEGTSMAGTESAWDFLSNGKNFSDLLRKLNADRHHVPHFEAVIGTNNFGGSASNASVLAWRMLD